MHNFPPNWKDLNVALCHDWLTGMRGGERVLEILCQGFPHSSISTLFCGPSTVSDIITSHPIITSHLQKVPGILRNYRHLLPLFIPAIRAMPAPQADLLISTSHCVAKALPTNPSTRHICYCFTPMRYAWTFFDEYFGNNPAKALLAKPMLAYLRAWDRRSASQVDQFIAISDHIRKRISRCYNRDSLVVYPPVDTTRCTPSDSPPSCDYDLIVSALVPYKKIDLAIRAYAKLGYPLKIVGAGSQLNHLQSLATPNIQFLGWLDDDQILDLYRNCRQLIFPGEEDFGIVPVEVQACGRPVVAFARGGALETIVADHSGVFFQQQSVESILDAISTAASTNWDPATIRNNAQRFNTNNFITSLTSAMTSVI